MRQVGHLQELWYWAISLHAAQSFLRIQQCLGTPKHFHITQTLKTHNHLQNTPPLVSITSQIFRALPCYLRHVFISFSIHTYVYLLGTFRFSHPNPVGIYLLPTATRYGLDGLGIQSRWGRGFPRTSRPGVGPTQIPTQCIPRHCRG